MATIRHCIRESERHRTRAVSGDSAWRVSADVERVARLATPAVGVPAGGHLLEGAPEDVAQAAISVDAARANVLDEDTGERLSD